jgi:hypothetical protein
MTAAGFGALGGYAWDLGIRRCGEILEISLTVLVCRDTRKENEEREMAHGRASEPRIEYENDLRKNKRTSVTAKT